VVSGLELGRQDKPDRFQEPAVVEPGALTEKDTYYKEIEDKTYKSEHDLIIVGLKRKYKRHVNSEELLRPYGQLQSLRKKLACDDNGDWHQYDPRKDKFECIRKGFADGSGIPTICTLGRPSRGRLTSPHRMSPERRNVPLCRRQTDSPVRSASVRIADDYCGTPDCRHTSPAMQLVAYRAPSLHIHLSSPVPQVLKRQESSS
jgi:hypothetical protein